MNKLKKAFIYCLSSAVLIGLSAGIYYALRSEIYTVREVEVAGSIDPAPLSSAAVLHLADVPTGRVSLFSLDMKAIEKRLLSSEWIQQVHIQLKPKNTLSIFVKYRVPLAVIQAKKGSLSLVDEWGKIYGSVNQTGGIDLPVLGGFNEQNPERLNQALKLISAWDQSPIRSIATISSIYWDDERGFRALVAYPLRNSSKNTESVSAVFGRTMVDLGSDLMTDLEARLTQLTNVFQYLGDEGVPARQIWADAGKKIVVKTSRGS